MNKMRRLDVARDLRGKPAYLAGTSQTLGVIEDAVLDPGKGDLLGFVMRGHPPRSRVVYVDIFQLQRRRLTIREEDLGALEEISALPAQGVYACGELAGTDVVTNYGELLGRVGQIYLSDDGRQIFYRVVAGGARGAFSSGFYLDATETLFYSRAGARLIVPSGSKARQDSTVRSININQPSHPIVGKLRSLPSLLNGYGAGLVLAVIVLIVGLIVWI